MKKQIVVTVNGEQHTDEVEPRLLLVHYLRDDLRLTGTHVGCETSLCGACTVVLNGQAVKSCTVLAVQADGGEVLTVEGLEKDGKLHPLQDGFWEEHGLQCGFCTPGMIMASYQLLQRHPNPTEEQIRHGLEGNLCRCTGYQHIVKAVQHAAKKATGDWGLGVGFPHPQSPTPHPNPWSEATMPITPKMVGTRIKRREDPRLITGQATYTDDLQLTGMLYMSVLRSIYAHAKINSIDVSKAKELPGVVTVLTGAEIAGQTGSVPCCVDVPGMKLPRHPVLAEGKVRYVGEPVAVVVATSRYVARDALDFIEVDYDPLDAVVDLEQAAEPAPYSSTKNLMTTLPFVLRCPTRQSIKPERSRCGRQTAHCSATPDPDGHGAARHRRPVGPWHEAAHRLVLDPDASYPAYPPGRHTAPTGEPRAGDCARSRRRVWREGQHLPGRDPGPVSGYETRQAGQMDPRAAGRLRGHDPRPGAGAVHRGRSQERWDSYRDQGQALD